MFRDEINEIKEVQRKARWASRTFNINIARELLAPLRTSNCARTHAAARGAPWGTPLAAAWVRAQLLVRHRLNGANNYGPLKAFLDEARGSSDRENLIFTIFGISQRSGRVKRQPRVFSKAKDALYRFINAPGCAFAS